MIEKLYSCKDHRIEVLGEKLEEQNDWNVESENEASQPNDIPFPSKLDVHRIGKVRVVWCGFQDQVASIERESESHKGK